MMLKRNLVLVIVGAVFFGLLSLLFLGALLGLAVRGILEAQDLNLCVRSNVTEDCIFAPSLENSENGSDPTSTVAPEEDRELDWAYYMAGSTAAAVVWALTTLVAMLFVVEVLRDKQKKDLDKLPKERVDEVAMTEMGKGAKAEAGGRGGGGGGSGGTEGEREDAGVRRIRLSGVDEPDRTKKGEVKERLVKEAGVPSHLIGRDEHDHYELEKDYIGAYQVREWHGQPLRHLGIEGSIAFLFCLLAIILSFECLLWAVALGYYHTNREEKQISAFVLVDFLSGFLLPLLLILASILLAIILDFVTIGRIDARKKIKRFLPSVIFEEGKDFDYWVIEERFYFKLHKRNKHLTHKHGLWYSCDKTLSTWLLTCIIALSVLICFSFFVNITVVEERTLSSCPADAGLYDCFNRTSFNFVDCTDDEVRQNVELIHCFRFLRFAVDTSLISSLSETFAFYLFTAVIFGRVFTTVKTLLHLHRSRLWGVAFLVVGGAAFVVTVVFLGIEDRFQIQVNFLAVMQVCMACLFVILVGVLVLRGAWYEKIFDHKKVKPIAELLLRYDHISNAEVQELERNYAREIKRDDPTSQHLVDFSPL